MNGAMREPVIVSACRTPHGRYLGSLLPLQATDLGGVVVAEAVRRAGTDPASVDECVMGNVVAAGLGQNPAWQAALTRGLPSTVNAGHLGCKSGRGFYSYDDRSSPR